MPILFGMSRRQLLVIIFTGILLFLIGGHLEIGTFGAFVIVLLLSVVLRFFNLIRFYKRKVEALQKQLDESYQQ